MLACGNAAADPAPAVNVRTWTPSTDPRANLILEPSSSLPFGTFATAAWAHYENDSVALRTTNAGTIASRPLQDQFGIDLVAVLGLGRRAELGVRLPMILAEQGSTETSNVVATGSVPASALGDLALVGKGTLRGNEDGGLGLVTLGELSLPTGTKTSFMSDSGPTLTLRVLADLSIRKASLQASLGYAVRTSHVEWPGAGAGAITFGDTIPWTLGVLLRPGVLHAIDPDARQGWEVALHGSLPAGPAGPFGSGDGGNGASAAESPVLLALSDRIGLGHFRDGFVLAGIDVGLDHAVGVPTARAIVGIGWTATNHDRDGDGIPDDLDQCPGIAEDRDGFEDADGCPEADNDDDGIVDAEDACPNVPGARSLDPRQNGCPADKAGRTHAPGDPRSHEP